MTRSITVTVQTALDVLAPTLPAAETDNLLPALCAVQLTRTGGFVRAVATDRYIAAISQVEEPVDTVQDSHAAEILLPVDLVKGILVLLRKNKSGFGTVTFIDDDRQVTANTDTGSVIAPALPGSIFPKVQTLVDKAVEDAAGGGAPLPSSPVNIHTARLAKLTAITKAAGKHANLCLQSTGEHKTVLFDVADRNGEVVVFGLVMPQRIDGTVAGRIRQAEAVSA